MHLYLEFRGHYQAAFYIRGSGAKVAGLRVSFWHGATFIESPSSKRETRRVMSLIGLRSLVCERNLAPLARKTFCQALVWGIVVRVCIGPVI